VLTGGCNAAFYDDRAYRTLNGTVVNSGNVVGNILCGGLPPPTAFANPITGYNSTTTQRRFGAASGGNANVPCAGNFGDSKGLDLWTYDQSNTAVAPLIIVASADIAVTKSVSDPTPAVGTNITFTVTARNLGPSNATGVQVRDVLPAGLTFVSAAPSQGSYSAGIWIIGNLAVGAIATLKITVTVTGTSKVTNTATRIAGNPTDYDPGNDSASASVTGSTIPGFPNTGVAPVATWWPALLPLALVITLAAAAFRRRPRTRRHDA
jgi:uncharacterized repeat protein (TIGR01451 family)